MNRLNIGIPLGPDVPHTNMANGDPYIFNLCFSQGISKGNMTLY
jgi:hypothetical protein